MERLDSTPKLLLSRLPSKACREPIIMQTPPVNTNLASIPFQWEEVPGKPRPTYNKIPSSVARCLELELPPRLLNSSTKVSPDDDDDMFESSKGSFVGLVKDVISEGKDEGVQRDGGISKRSKLGESFRSFGSFSKGSLKNQRSGVKICNRVRRKGSFLGISHASSSIWAGIYGSFKQVVPWRWRQQ